MFSLPDGQCFNPKLYIPLRVTRYKSCYQKPRQVYDPFKNREDLKIINVCDTHAIIHLENRKTDKILKIDINLKNIACDSVDGEYRDTTKMKHIVQSINEAFEDFEG